MTAKKILAEQTAIRKAMLANGYVPLANKEKMTLIEGWPTLDVDEALIDEWESSLAFRSTGLRIDPPLVAVDIDVEDRAIVDTLWEACKKRFGKAAWADKVLIRGRTDGSAKETWLFKVDEPFPTTGGARYVAPGDDPEAEGVKTHRVELFGGGSGKQIGAYGAHTPGLRPEDPPLVSYAWVEDEGPHNTHIDRLPSLPKAEVYAIVTLAGDIMKDAGWHMTSPFAPGEGSGETRYDLTREMTFKVKAGNVPYDELGSHKSCRMREITGEGSNTERGRIYVDEVDCHPFVWDSATLITHKLSELKPRDLSEAMKSVADKLRELYGAEMAQAEAEPVVERDHTVDHNEELRDWAIEDSCDGLEDFELLSQMAFNLTRRFAHWPTNPTGNVVDIYTGTTYSMRSFVDRWAPYELQLETLTPGGNPTTKMFNPADSWRRHEHRVTVSGEMFDPSITDRLIPDENDLSAHLFNIYTPPLAGVEPMEDTSLFWDHMDHLLPDEIERAYFMNWLACKAQMPHEIGVVVMMYTPKFGVGRGTLFEVLTTMFGTRWVSKPTAKSVLALNGGTNETTFMHQKVLMLVDEFDVWSNDERFNSNIYNQLKSLHDPAAGVREITGKYKASQMAHVFASGIYAMNTLPPGMPEHDRRFVVLRNSDTMLEATPLLKRWNAVRSAGQMKALAAGVLRDLRAMGAVKDDFMTPIETETKQLARETRRSPIERELADALDQWPAPLALIDNIIAYVRTKMSTPAQKEMVRPVVENALVSGFCGWTSAPPANGQGKQLLKVRKSAIAGSQGDTETDTEGDTGGITTVRRWCKREDFDHTGQNIDARSGMMARVPAR